MSESDSAKFKESFQHRYRASIGRGLIRDPEQERVVIRMGQLGSQLIHRERLETGMLGLWQRLLRHRKHVRGLYLWGGVGRGKTALMNMFFHWLPIANKKRLHFHSFMQRVHRKLTVLQGQSDPLKSVARSFTADAQFFCLDEFYVEDIGDAMVLAELLSFMFEFRATIVATSNTRPADLYLNGLQRKRFLPAIDLIQNHMEVLHLGGEADYRLARLRNAMLYQLIDELNGEALRAEFIRLAEEEPEMDYPMVINDRLVVARFHVEGIAGFDFETLCDAPRSAADYIELGKLYHTIVVYGLFSMSAKHENQARRFIAFIDELYDRNVNVQFFAKCLLDDLYRGARYRNEFERTRSRMIEMQSPEYLARAHRRRD